LFAEWAVKEQNRANFDCHMAWLSTASIIYMLPMHETPGYKN
jgi:hypothetical protein